MESADQAPEFWVEAGSEKEVSVEIFFERDQSRFLPDGTGCFMGNPHDVECWMDLLLPVFCNMRRRVSVYFRTVHRTFDAALSSGRSDCGLFWRHALRLFCVRAGIDFLMEEGENQRYKPWRQRRVEQGRGFGSKCGGRTVCVKYKKY